MRRNLIKRERIVCFILGIFAAVMLCGCGTEYVLTTGFKDNEIFRIEQASASREEYLIYLSSMEQQYKQAFGDTIWQQTADGVTLEENAMQTVLARLVKVKMMNLLAKENELTLTDEEILQAQNAAKEYQDSIREEDQAALGNISQETLQTMYEEYALAYKVYDYYTAAVNTELSDDEVRKVTVRQITIPYATEEEKQKAQTDMELAIAAIEGGESFEAVAAIYNRAEEETLEIGKGQMDSTIENAVFNLSEGAYSGILDADNALHLYLCISTYDAADVEAEKVRRQEEMRQSSFDSVYNVYAEQKECFLNHAVWDELEPSTIPELQTADFFEIYDRYFTSTHF